MKISFKTVSIVLLAILILGLLGGIIYLWTHPRYVEPNYYDENNKVIAEEEAMSNSTLESLPQLNVYIVTHAKDDAEFDMVEIKNSSYYIDKKNILQPETIDNVSPGSSEILNQILDDYRTDQYLMIDAELGTDTLGNDELRQYVIIGEKRKVFYVIVENSDYVFANPLPYASLDEYIEVIKHMKE